VIELVIAACLATGECRDFSLLYDPYQVSLMTCIVAGQPRSRAGMPGIPSGR
jgi:hypothetical protein